MRANKGFVKFRSPVVAAVAALVLAGAAHAGTATWVGPSSYWQDSWRWQSFGVPGAGDDAVVAAPYAMGVTVTVSSTYPSYFGPVEVGSLTVGTGNSIQITYSSLKVGGGIVNDGELRVGTGAYYFIPSTLKIGADSTLSGTGKVTLGSGALDLGGHTLTIGSGQTVRGTGDINNGALVNQGLLMADNLMNFNAGVTYIDNSLGRISAGANGILSLSQTHITGGVITAASGGVIYGSIGAYKPTFSKVTFEGDVRLGAEMALVDAANKGTLRINGSSAVTTVQGALVNDGNIHVSQTLAVQGNAKLTGDGTVWLVRESKVSGGYLEVAANSTLTIDDAQTVRGVGRIRGYADSHVVNHGTLIAEGGLMYLSAGDGTLDNSAGHITVAHDGWLVSAGTLQLGDGSTLTFDVGSSAADHGVFQLQSSTPQSLDGTLQLNIGYGAQVGDSFTLLSYWAGETGTFDQVIAAGYTVSTSYNATDLTVTITGVSAVPEPASWMLAGAGLVLIGRRARKQASRA